MGIVATLTFPGPRKQTLTIKAPFDSAETATAAVESLIVGGLASHVRDVRANLKTKAVDVYAIGCSCFGHTIEDPEPGKKPKPSVALSFHAGELDEHSVEVVRNLIAKGAPRAVEEDDGVEIAVFEEGDAPAEPIDPKAGAPAK